MARPAGPLSPGRPPEMRPLQYLSSVIAVDLCHYERDLLKALFGDPKRESGTRCCLTYIRTFTKDTHQAKDTVLMYSRTLTANVLECP